MIERLFLKQKNAITTVSWIIILYTVFPFVLLCFFNVPLGDDLWYAKAYQDYGILGTQTHYYETWSGRYTATFLISTLNPVSYGYLNLAFLHPLLLLVATIFSFKFFTDEVVKVFKLKISKLLFLAVLLFFYLNYLPDIGESFYWMAGAYTYQVPVIFLLLYLTLLSKIFTTDSKSSRLIKSVLAMFCLIIIIGSNEVSTIYLLGLSVLILFGIIIFNQKQLWLFLPLLFVTVTLSYIMIFAEGNFARTELFEKQSFHAVKSAAHALSRSIFVLFFWIPTLLMLLLFIPGISNVKLHADLRLEEVLHYKGVYWLSALVILIAAFIGFFPSIYTTNWIPQRAYTPIFFVVLVLALLLFLSLCTRTPVFAKLNSFSRPTRTWAAMLFLLVVSFSHNSNVMNAYLDLASGKAASHHAQVMKAYQDLDNASSTDTITVREIVKRPLILPTRWPQKHNRLVNGQWEQYFKVEKVELE